MKSQCSHTQGRLTNYTFGDTDCENRHVYHSIKELNLRKDQKQLMIPTLYFLCQCNWKLISRLLQSRNCWTHKTAVDIHHSFLACSLVFKQEGANHNIDSPLFCFWKQLHHLSDTSTSCPSSTEVHQDTLLGAFCSTSNSWRRILCNLASFSQSEIRSLVISWFTSFTCSICAIWEHWHIHCEKTSLSGSSSDSTSGPWKSRFSNLDASLTQVASVCAFHHRHSSCISLSPLNSSLSDPSMSRSSMQVLASCGILVVRWLFALSVWCRSLSSLCLCVHLDCRRWTVRCFQVSCPSSLRGLCHLHTLFFCAPSWALAQASFNAAELDSAQWFFLFPWCPIVCSRPPSWTSSCLSVWRFPQPINMLITPSPSIRMFVTLRCF